MKIIKMTTTMWVDENGIIFENTSRSEQMVTCSFEEACETAKNMLSSDAVCTRVGNMYICSDPYRYLDDGVSGTVHTKVVVLK